MITDPMKYAEPFAKAGSDLLTFHIEVTDTPMKVIEHIRSLGVRVGVTLNPGTDAAAIWPVVDAVDLVLVMSVWPGFGGQKFIPDSLDKLRAIRSKLRPDQRLEVDGGIGPTTAADVVAAGADTLVAGSAVFDQPDPARAMLDLEQLGRKADRSAPPITLAPVAEENAVLDRDFCASRRILRVQEVVPQDVAEHKTLGGVPMAGRHGSNASRRPLITYHPTKRIRNPMAGRSRSCMVGVGMLLAWQCFCQSWQDRAALM